MGLKNVAVILLAKICIISASIPAPLAPLGYSPLPAAYPVPAAAPQFYSTSVFSSPLLPPAVNPVVARGVLPASVPYGISPPLVPGAYSAGASYLPAPFAFQARSIHAVAPAVVPAVAPALPPFAVAAK